MASVSSSVHHPVDPSLLEALRERLGVGAGVAATAQSRTARAGKDSGEAGR